MSNKPNTGDVWRFELRENPPFRCLDRNDLPESWDWYVQHTWEFWYTCDGTHHAEIHGPFVATTDKDGKPALRNPQGVALPLERLSRVILWQRAADTKDLTITRS